MSGQREDERLAVIGGWLAGDGGASAACVRLAADDPDLVVAARNQRRIHVLLHAAFSGADAAKVAGTAVALASQATTSARHQQAQAIAAGSVAGRSARRSRAPAGSGRRVPMAAWALAAALILAVGGWFLDPFGVRHAQEKPGVAIAVVSHAGPGAIVIRAGRDVAVSDGMEVRAEDSFRVPDLLADGSVEVTYPDRTRMTLLAATGLRLWNDDGAKRVSLDHGEVRCEVAPQPAGKPMRLITSQAEAEIVGTRFSLRADEGLTRLQVAEGTVSFRRADGTVSMVHAGGSAESAVVPRAATSGDAGAVVLRYDFEDGLKPATVMAGDVVPGPERTGNRFCLRGGEKPHGNERTGEVGFETREDGLFSYARGMRLSFDCWYTGDQGVVEVWVWDLTQAKNVRLKIGSLTQGRWTRVDIGLDELRLEMDAAHGLEDGDRISTLVVGTALRPGDAIYVDDVVVMQPGKSR